jgi:hypothetical protein
MADPLYSWQSTDKMKADAQKQNPSFSDPMSTGQDPYGAAQPAGNNAFGTGGFGALGNVSPAAPGAKSSFSDVITNNPFSKPLVTAASHAIYDNLEGKPKPSFSDTLARNDFIKSSDEATRKVMEASALNGRAATGQLGGDAANYLTSQVLPQRANLEATIADNAQKRADANQQSALGQFSNLASLAQQGEQFKENLADQQAGRTWQSTENEKSRTAAATDSALGRELQKYIADAGMNLDSKKLEENIREFNTKQDFDTWATKAGLDEQVAQRIWQSNENDIQRKVDQGMQLTAGEQNIRLETMKEAHDTAIADLQHTLNLDTMEKQNQHDVLLKQMDQTFTNLMTDKGYSHEEATNATKQQYAKELQKLGYDEQTALQAADNFAKAQEHQKDLDQTKLLAEADMAQKYDFFNKDLQQKYGFHEDDVALTREKLDAEANQFAESMGLDKDKFEYLKKTDAFQQVSDTTSTLMAMAGDDPDMLRFAAENFYKGLGSTVGPDGKPLMSPDQVAQGLLGIKAKSFSSADEFVKSASAEKTADGAPKYTADQIQQAAGGLTSGTTSSKQALADFTAFVNKTGGFADDAAKEKFNASMIKYRDLGVGMDPSKISGVPDNSENNSLLSDADKRLKTKGVDTSINYRVRRVGETNTHSHYNATQKGFDYAVYTKMVNSGLNEADAQTALQKLIGPDRATAALSLETPAKK